MDYCLFVHGGFGEKKGACVCVCVCVCVGGGGLEVGIVGGVENVGSEGGIRKLGRIGSGGGQTVREAGKKRDERGKRIISLLNAYLGI